MKRSKVIGLTAALIVVALLGAAIVSADSGRRDVKARLSGDQEVPPISTKETATLRLHVNASASNLTFELSCSGLEGGAVTASHIHFGPSGANGAPIAFLCGGGTKPACPASPATISGTFVPADVLDASAHGIAPGQFSEAVAAIQAGMTYVTIHTAAFPTGEIRGAIKGGKGD